MIIGNGDSERRVWTKRETRMLATVYMKMAGLQDDDLLGTGKNADEEKRTSKASLVREFMEKTGRTKGSVEAKLMNISAVVEELGDECEVSMVFGYKPLSNLSQSCREIVTERFSEE